MDRLQMSDQPAGRGRSDDPFCALFDRARQGVLLTDRTGAVRYANPAACALVGGTAADLAGRSYCGAPWWTQREAQLRIRDAVERAASGELVRLETTRGDLPVRRVELLFHPVVETGGNVIALIVQECELAGGSRSHVASEMERPILEAVLQQSPVAMIVVSLPDSIVRHVNEVAIRILGIPDEKRLMDCSLADVWARLSPTALSLSPGASPPGALRLERILRGEPSSDFECRIRRADGSRIRLGVEGGPVRDPTGATFAGVLVFRDLTEDSLRKSQARLEMAQAQAHIGSWEYNVETGELIWSKELARLLGFEEASSPQVSWPPLDFIHQDDRPMVSRVHRRAVDSGEPGTCEFRADPERLPGRYFVMTCELCRDALGQPLHVSGTMQDITDRKRAEAECVRLQDQLQQATKMEAVGRLAGGVAHDFNNLLTVISGNIELTRLDLDPSDPLTQNLDEVAKAAASAAQLTRQLLAFSRRQIVEPRGLNINDLVESLQKMLGRLIGEHIKLEISLAKDLRSVKVDPGQFDQVVVNLAINARDAMPDGGRLLIETSNIDVDEAICRLHSGLHPGPFVMVAVSDTGRGMTKEVRSRIFEPFFTTKPEGRGTGLGLAMIFGVVKQSGGAIDVYSEVGHGTTFKIYLPSVDPSHDDSVGSAVAQGVTGGEETILLIEDETAVRELCASFLIRQGYTVLVAGNPDEALACANGRLEPIDLLLTDVVLPGLNGRELADRILMTHPEMVVLFTSGYTQDSIIRHGVLTDRVHFISKPYSLHAIASKVRHLLDMRAIRAGTGRL